MCASTDDGAHYLQSCECHVWLFQDIMHPCGNGTLRNLEDSFPLALPPSQIPYLALVAGSFVAPAAADAFVLAFSSE